MILRDVINLIDCWPAANPSLLWPRYSSPVPGAVKRYHTSHSGEIVETKRVNHKTLNTWKAPNDSDNVESLLQKIKWMDGAPIPGLLLGMAKRDLELSEGSFSTLPNHLREAVEYQLTTEADDDTASYVAIQLGDFIRAENKDAVALLEALVAANKERAKIILAELLAAGDGIEQDCPRSIELLVSAADSGSVRAMLMLCDHYDGRRDHADTDPKKALHYLRAAADLGNETGAECLADRLVNGRCAEQCAPEEVAEIERLYQASHYASNSYYKLAMLHSLGKQSYPSGKHTFPTLPPKAMVST